MHRMRPSRAENGIPAAIQRRSKATTKVLLFVALSITNAVIWVESDAIQERVRSTDPANNSKLLNGIPYRRGRILTSVLSDEPAEVYQALFCNKLNENHTLMKTMKLTEFSVISDVMNNNRHECEAIA
jgi:hypothetical protein